MYGWGPEPATQKDYSIFRKTQLCKNRNKYFREGDKYCVLYDKAFSNHKFHDIFVTPYHRYVSLNLLVVSLRKIMQKM